MALDKVFEGKLSKGIEAAEMLSGRGTRMRSGAFDAVLHRRVLPIIATHGTMIGGCLVLAMQPLPGWNAVLLFGASLFLLAACIALFATGATRDGLFSAVAVLFLEAMLAAKSDWLLVTVAITIIYGALLALNLALKRDGKGFATLPLYAPFAFFCAPSQGLVQDAFLAEEPLWQSAAMFLPIFLFGLAIGASRRKIGLCAASFAGLILVGIPAVDTDHGSLFLLAVAALMLLGVFLYMAILAREPVSNARSFVNHGVVATVLLFVLLLVGNDGSRVFLWWWPVATAAVLSLSLIGGPKDALVSVVSWFAITLTVPIWAYPTGYSGFADFLPRELGSAILAASLYLFARQRGEPLAANIAIAILFLALLVPTLSCIFQEMPQDLTLPQAALLLTVPLMGLLALHRPVPTSLPALPWWRGFIHPRHAYYIRLSYRVSGQWLVDLPVVGAFFKFVPKALGALRHVKSGGTSPRFAEIALLAGMALFVFAGISVLDGSVVSPALLPRWVAGLLLWSACAILLHLCGILFEEALFHFAALVFGLVPLGYLLTNHDDPLDPGRAGLVTMAFAAVLLLGSILRNAASIQASRRARETAGAGAPVESKAGVKELYSPSPYTLGVR